MQDSHVYGYVLCSCHLFLIVPGCAMGVGDSHR